MASERNLQDETNKIVYWMESEKPKLMEIGRPPNGTANALSSLWKGFGTVTSKQARSGQTGDPAQVVTTGRTTSTAMERGMRVPIEANFVGVAGVVGR